jgi:membrane protease YdiL (CAAX protease family)
MNTQNKSVAITKRNLWIFAIFVLISGWIGEFLNEKLELDPDENLGMLFWLVSPLLATLFLRAFAGDGWKDMGLKPLLKDNVRWYIFSLLVFPVLTISGVLIGYTFGWISMPNFDYSVFFQAFLLALIPNFFKNIPEEFVWRGYLTPKLASLNLSDFKLYFIVGIIWGAWHIPYYLYFLDADTVGSFTGIPLSIFIPLTIVTMIAWSVVFIEIWFLTRSIWPAVIMHMVEDAFVNPLILDASFVIDSSYEILVHPIVGLTGIILFTTVGLALRKIRRAGEGNPIS